MNKRAEAGEPTLQENRKAGEAQVNPVPKQRSRRGAGRAQAMVEFALALPVFLLMVYGIIEVGRLMFMQAAVVTASREGVRYASAWGVNGAVAHQYLDCTGIRNAAKNTGILLGLQNSNITIAWDDGISTTPNPYCDGVHALPVLASGKRVVVTVTANYKPVLPLLPNFSRTMSSTSRRTILGDIDLAPTPTPAS